MGQWDRKTLLHMVEEAGKCLNNPMLSVTQRHSLQALLAHYGNKAKSVQASKFDVQSMQVHLSQILGPRDGAA